MLWLDRVESAVDLMKWKFNFCFSCVFFILKSFEAASSEVINVQKVPDGFADLVEPKKRNLSIFSAADTAIKFNGEFVVSGDNIKFTGSHYDLKKELKEVLSVNDIGSEKIASELISGVNSSLDCVGYRFQCALNPQDIDFVYDPANQSLIIHINPRFMDGKTRKENIYISEETDKSALIMNHEFSYNASYTEGGINNIDDSYSYYNSSFIGLGSTAFVNSSTNYGTTNGFSAENISINSLSNNFRVRLGYIDDNKNWNNTSFLERNSSISGYISSFGSSNELRKSSVDSAQRVYFSSPRAGRLEVVNTQGRVLVSRNVEIGQQYLSYSELPKGSYTVTIKVFDGKSSIYEEKRVILNDDNKFGAVRELDYLASFGYLSKNLTNTSLHESESSAERIYDDYNSPFFSDLKVSTRFTDRLTIGVGTLVTTDDNYSYGGLNYFLFDSGSVSFTGGVFSDDSTYYSADFYLEGLSVSWRHFNSTNEYRDDVSLADIIYDNNDYSKWVANYYYALNNRSSIYLSGSWNQSSDDDLQLKIADNQIWTLNTGYTLSGLSANSQLTFDFGVTGDDLSDNDYTFNVNFSVPLSSKHSYTHNAFVDKRNGGDTSVNHRDTLTSSWVNNENISLSTDVSTYYAFDDSVGNETDLSTSISGGNDYVSGSGYFYLDSVGARNGNVFLKTNTVTTSDRTFFTNKQSPSYLIIENETGALDNNGKLTSVVQERKNSTFGRSYAISKGYDLNPLDVYKEYEFVVDDDASDFYNSGDTYKKGASYPGHVVHLKTKMGRLKTFISTFVDIKGDEIEDIECVGLGCVEVELLTKGVYQFKVKGNLPYKILSKSEQCVIPAVKNSFSTNLGTNFCMPSFEDDSEGYEIAKISDNYFYYIGKFKDLEALSVYKDGFFEQDVNFIEKSVDEYTYVFIKVGQKLSPINLVKVSYMMSYALVDGEDKNYASNK